MKNLLLALIVLVCVGCVYEVRTYQIKNVTKILFRDPRDYQIFTEDPVTKEVDTQRISGSIEIKIIADAPENEPMWIDVETGIQTKYKFHIHSGADIAGGNTGGKQPQQIDTLE